MTEIAEMATLRKSVEKKRFNCVKRMKILEKNSK